MAQALFVTREDIVKFTALNGNIDTDKFIQWVKVAQDIHIQNYLGTKLFNKINDAIVANNLANPYLMLLNVYIKPMVIHWTMVEYLPFAAYTIANKGVFKHGSENSSNVEKSEVDFLVEKERSIAQNYTRRFIDYMSFNQSSFPEYNTNSNADVYPDKQSDFGGWYL
ncbi:hypothetical protein UFOVP324_24 [uncultured Caudovirales phage]|jgi:hypothetical protein|uniref:Uncharacterized protein n=1 Tax=uncultured Caudovirales phage TaxID=2100421 RepID=A0A6J5LRV5_9CAUD|nr:hypothetical protein UFOVP324_24 [uncultured Caudovirales phage]